jgi:hypothetical protein
MTLKSNQPPLPSESEFCTRLPDLGSVWKLGQFASPELAPSPTLIGSGPAFLDVSGDCSSGVDALGERLRCSLPVISESGAPIYPSESNSVFRYSWKPKVGRLDEHLLAEALAATNAPLAPSMSLIGAIAKPLLAPAPFRDEVSQPLLWSGFLLPSNVVLPPSEVIGSPLSVVQSMFGCPPLFSNSGVSYEGNVKEFLELMVQVDEEQRLEALVFTSKFKGSPEVKNLQIMMPGVLVIVGVRQKGHCCNVMVSGFCRLVMLGCLGFLLFLGFVGVFPSFSIFSCFGVIFIYFLYA